jgi:hypothetical protein
MVRRYQDVLEEKKNNFRIANNLKTTNGLRSMLDIYQQKAEYESRLKVARIEKELDVKEFLDNNEVPEYERNVRIVNRREGDEARKTETATFQDFFARSKRLLDLYYEDVYMKDRLSSLTDDEILYTIKETPTKIKRAAKDILDKLERHNIKVTEDGKLDFSQCQSPAVKRKLENNPWVKYALLQRDLGYGFTHLDARKATAESIKKEAFGIHAEEKRQEEIATKEERELELKKQTAQSEIDKKIGFLSSGGFTKTKDNEESSGLRHTNPKDLIEGKQYRLDPQDSLVESFPERLLRLEKKWFRDRLANINGGVEGDTENEIKEKYKVLTEKLRRVKLQLEREAMDKAEDLLFDEHRRVREEGIWTENIPIERLLNYYSLPVDQRQSGLVEDTEFFNVKSLVKRREVVEDLVPYHDITYKNQMGIEDSEEFKNKIISEEKKRRTAESISQARLRREIGQEAVMKSAEAASSKKVERILTKKSTAEKKKMSLLEKIRERVEFGVQKRKELGITEDPADNKMRGRTRIGRKKERELKKEAKDKAKGVPGAKKERKNK